jgi:imidazolonepropionase-like amidohydrolase
MLGEDRYVRMLPLPVRGDEERGGAVFENVTVINPGVDRMSAQTLVVRSSNIESISDSARAVPPARSSYEGGYVLPGLIDMHVHQTSPADSSGFVQWELLYLAYGVIGLRDVGDRTGTVLQTRDRIQKGLLAGPRIFSCGRIIDGEPPLAGRPQIAHNAAEAESIVDATAATGADCIKVYTNLSPDALRGVRDAAIRHHLPLVGHVPATVTFEDAHLDDVQHFTGVPVMEPGPYRNRPVFIRALNEGWKNLDDRRTAFIVRTSVEQRLVHTPTNVGEEQTARLLAGQYDQLLSETPEAYLLPRYYQEILWRPELYPGKPHLDPSDVAMYREKRRKVQIALHQAGVTLHVGTDTIMPFLVPGKALWQEMQTFVQRGYTPEEVWAAATWQNAESLPLAGLGKLKAGAPADLLLFKEDPTADLSALCSLEAVVADGRLYSKGRLDNELARNRDHFNSWFHDHLFMAAAWLVTRL